MDRISSPLEIFESLRPQVLQDVVGETLRELGDSGLDPENTLASSLYSERERMRRFRPNLFTFQRHASDRKIWSRVQRALLLNLVDQDRSQTLKEVLSHAVRHTVEEIGGQFHPGVYRFATQVVPIGFNWLLNASASNKFWPFGLQKSAREALQDRIEISGHVKSLQNLAQKGTILLVPTHQSNIDSILIGYVIYLMGLPPFAYGAGLNLFSNPILSFFMKNLGAYTVDRQKGHTLYKLALKNYSTRILREGIHSIFFPGGGRSRSGAIENKLKLGLLGTGLGAQIEGLRRGSERSRVFVVPMVMSYHFVLEASNLIHDYLAESGKHQFIMTDDDSYRFLKVVRFFWKIFKADSGMKVRVGRPLDVFGNYVDENGESMGPNGTTIDPIHWLTTRGMLGPDRDRDAEYTRRLGARLVERYYEENTVLTSHAVAFSFFEALRRANPDLDLYRFLRMSYRQRALPWRRFLEEAQLLHERLRRAADAGKLHLTQELYTTRVEDWVEDGIRNLGLLHDAELIRRDEESVTSEDLSLLYYYRNRLAGYGLSLLSDPKRRLPGGKDAQGFLA